MRTNRQCPLYKQTTEGIHQFALTERQEKEAMTKLFDKEAGTLKPHSMSIHITSPRWSPLKLGIHKNIWQILARRF